MSRVLTIFKRLLNSICYKRQGRILPNNNVEIYDNNIPEYIIDEINEAAINDAISQSINETPVDINHNISEINAAQNKIKKVKKRQKKKCPICLENVEYDPVKCKNNKCKASYHNICIKTWKETKALPGNKIPCLLCTLDTISIPNRLSLRNFGYPGNRTTNRVINRTSVNRSPHRATHRSTHRPTNRPTDRPINRPINRPTDRPPNNFRDYNYDNILNRPANDRSSNRNTNLRNYAYENNSQNSNASINYRPVYLNNRRLGNRYIMNNSHAPQSMPVH